MNEHRINDLFFDDLDARFVQKITDSAETIVIHCHVKVKLMLKDSFWSVKKISTPATWLQSVNIEKLIRYKWMILLL